MNRIFPIIVLLVAVGLFFGYVHPTYTGDIAALRATIAGYDRALAVAETFRKKEEALVTQQEAIPAADRARVEAFLPDGVDNVQLIVDLNALATRSGIKLSGFDVAAPEEAPIDAGRLAVEGQGPTESLDISVSAVGTYAAFRTFLANAELSLRPMDLVDLSIGDSTTGVYSYQMKFRIYWLR